VSRIGLFTSAWDQVAIDLVEAIHCNFPEQVSYVLVSREPGETHYGDLMIEKARELQLPLISFSSLGFKPELRETDREAWRVEHDAEIAKLLPLVDLIVLVGYMWVISENMCHQNRIINLHPALPNGPKGTYRQVIWELIKEQAAETGVMMHLITPEVDEGPPVAYCRFSIRGGEFDPLWQAMGARLSRGDSLEQIEADEGESNPLFQAIRRYGVARELPLIVWTIKAFIEGRVEIEGERVLPEGQALDLTGEINATLDTAEV